MELRPTTPEDLTPLWREFQSVARAGETYAQDEAATLQEFDEYWRRRGGEQWSAVEGQRWLGAYTLRANQPGRGAHVATASYLVAREARGEGVGRRMGEHSIERARALGFEALQFNLVVDANEPAVKLWKSLGFQVVGTLPGAFRHRSLGLVDAHVMHLRLAPAVESALDGLVHREVLVSFVQRGFAPTADELARTLASTRPETCAALRRLHVAHGLVLHPGSHEVWIAHPFSSSPSSVWVESAERGWWSPCLWCAMGVVALTAPDATLHARWGGESELARIEVRGGRVTAPECFVHFAAPPRDAWTNVVQWCACVQPFRRVDDVAAWRSRHGVRGGETLPIEKVVELGRVWYGRHLDADWRKWTVAQAQAIFDRLGLSGDFWRLSVSERSF